MSGRVYLAKVISDDLNTLLKWSNDLDLMTLQTTGVLRPLSLEAETRWFENQHKHAGRVFTYNIRLTEDDTLIGFVGYYGYDARNRIASIGVAIAEPDYREKGYGTEAMRLMIEYGFNELNLNRIELTVSSFNARAIRVYEKVGFMEEGVLRQSYFGDGMYHDTTVMSLLREEWEA